MGVEGKLLSEQGIEVAIEVTGGNDRRVLHFQGAGSSIAGVGKGGVFDFLPLFVDGIENFTGQDNFPPYFKFVGIRGSAKLQGYAAYGFYVVGYLITLFSVSPCDDLNQFPAFVGQANGNSVKFKFAYI